MKKTVAVIFGGASSEYEISLKSAAAVIENLDKDKYDIVNIGITRTGKWLRYYGGYEEIKNDRWLNSQDCISCFFSPDKSERILIEIKGTELVSTKVDVAFPVLHGKNGEDGAIQGLLEICGISYVGCDIITSAVCLDKDMAHKLVKAAGFNVPESLVINHGYNRENMLKFIESIGYPVYVKPANEGSSIGMTKAYDENQLFEGIEEAFRYDRKVVLEENIDGFEVGCAIIGNDELVVGTVDEIETPGGFFNFKEKYTLENSKIHLPGRIDSSLSEKIKAVGMGIYRALGCKGLSRVDLFVDKNQRIVFNEVNTLPGFTEGSRFPRMLLNSGMEYKSLLDKLIQLALDSKYIS